jgi:hypothetical protein
MAKWFNDTEIEGLSPELVEMLDEAREGANTPFVITAGYAKSRGKHIEHSAHLRGLAVDIRCWDSWSRFRIVCALLEAGFTRIGIYDKHIHADIDTELPERVIWVGTSK